MDVVTDAIFGDHLRNVRHPESPDRVEVVAARLRSMGLLDDIVPARDATDDELRLVHNARYLELVKREASQVSHPRNLSTGDVIIDDRSLAVARRAAGGAVIALETAVERNHPVFALVRPPGHHAQSDRGMGFCLFNNAAIAARAHQSRHGGTVLVVDFDYHHGNGTQDIVGDGLSYVSTHASPAYPGTGFENESYGDALLANVPLPVTGISTEAFVAVWERLLALVAAELRPQAIVVSAGFDYVAGDPVGDLGVDVDAAAALARAINRVGYEYCHGRVAYVLEGGYAIDALTSSIAQILTSDAGGGNAADPRAIEGNVAAALAATERCVRARR
ncbi:MAG TPA: histone deacetylase [Candidatus Aquilonibacter sp.]|nr:histone deacetylase [Candidatus Aquilonibacter sp.]